MVGISEHVHQDGCRTGREAPATLWAAARTLRVESRISSQGMALCPAWPATNPQDDDVGDAAGPAGRNDGPVWPDMKMNSRQAIPETSEDGHTLNPVGLQWEESRRTRKLLAEGCEEAASIDKVHTLPGPSACHRVPAGLPVWNTGCRETVALVVHLKFLNLLSQECIFRAITVSK